MFRRHSHLGFCYVCPINILNIYAPYKNRLPFWEKLFASEIFDIESLMIAGDLNVTLNPEERWGKSRKRDPLADRIKCELLHMNLIDTSKMMPTWDNGRIEEAYVAKRIDRFTVHASIIDRMGMPYSSIGNVFISDHRPIYLSWREKGFRKGYPFKFSRCWLEEPDFNEIVSRTWKDLSARDKIPPFLTFRDKMATMRKVVKDWQIKKRHLDKKDLWEIQKELDTGQYLRIPGC